MKNHLVASPEECVSLVNTDERFAAFRASIIEGSIIVQVGGVSLLCAWPPVWRGGERLEKLRDEAQNRFAAVILVGEETLFEEVPSQSWHVPLLLMPVPATPARVLATFRSAVELGELRALVRRQRHFSERYQYELGELVAIAKAIASERDIDTLLGLILKKSREITGADAGSVYVLEGEGSDVRERWLHFMLSQNDSMPFDFARARLRVDESSIVGRAVIAREPIHIPDLYALGESNPYGFRHDRSFDLETGYQTRSMLTVPMINQRDEVIGCIQLINRKRDPAARLRTPQDFDRLVVPFDERSIELSLTLASHAGVSLENALLYRDIQRLFESFVKAAVTAIDSRDPTTAGHSLRVAALTVALAEAVNRTVKGPYKDVFFTDEDLRQIRYAGLLHDFGKVGVRENLLMKAKKLTDEKLKVLLLRFESARMALRYEALQRKFMALTEKSENGEEWSANIDKELESRLGALDEMERFVLVANEPRVLEEGGLERLLEIARTTYKDGNGREFPLLTEEELHALSVRKGSLTEEERRQVESHVEHTMNFLDTIPWGKQFAQVPLIAGAHHEKLDGSGYPRGVKGEAIPLAARMMAIADLYDALVAQDRPYKRAVPPERALSIIGEEVRLGRLDAELYRIFIEEEVYKRVP